MTDDAPQPRLEIVHGTADDEELAALLAVVTQAFDTEHEEAVAEEPKVSAWDRTRRGLRKPLRRDIPWGRFHR